MSRAKEGVSEGNERYRAIVETVRDYAIFTTDPEGRIETWPSGAEAVFGWSAGEAMGQLMDMTYMPEDRAAGVPAQERRQAQETGQAANVRWHLHRNGSRVFIEGVARPLTDSDGALLGFVKVGQDTTRRRRAEEQLQLATEAAALGIFDVDFTTGVMEWDARQRELWRIGPEEVITDETFMEGVHPEDRDQLQEVLAQAFRPGSGGLYAAEYRLRPTEDGRERWVAATGRVHFDGERPVRLIGTVRDTSGHKRIEAALRESEARLRELNESLEQRVTERTAELEQAQEALRQSQKLEAMGQLTGGVAHDFNNLLTPILGSLDMLMRRGMSSERERRLIDGALQSAERAKTLVQRLLAFARRQPLQPGPVDLKQLVGAMADLIASTSGPRVAVRVDLPADLPPSWADANQLEMAVLNLAVNARDAMPEGGVLTVSARRESVRGHHPARLRPGHYVRLSVQDTGTGMDKATLVRAVEPFFSTKGIGKGTGLGLSMVHGLVSQLNGGMEITSSPGEGTTVELWLPVSPVALEEDRRTSQTTIAFKARGTALLVDDEDLVRMSTADMLTDLGYEVVEAGSAEKALSLVGEGLHPDLVVTDHLMPGLSGVDLAHGLRSRWPDLPVLIVSGYAGLDGIAPGLPRLTKPFRYEELAASIEALRLARAT